MGELPHCVGSPGRQSKNVIQRLSQSAFGCGCVDGLGAGQAMRNRRFVIRITTPAVIGEQRDLVLSGQMSQDVKGTNLPAGIDRQQFSCLDPEYFHWSVGYQHNPS